LTWLINDNEIDIYILLMLSQG